MFFENKNTNLNCEQIRRLCLEKLCRGDAKNHFDMLSSILKVCDLFREKYEESLFECDDNIMDDIEQSGNISENIGEEIRLAYHSAMFPELRKREDVYFEGKEQAKLLNWSERISPYQELRRVSAQYFENRGISHNDVLYFFQELAKVLELETSSEEFQKNLNLILSKYYVFLDDLKR